MNYNLNYQLNIPIKELKGEETEINNYLTTNKHTLAKYCLFSIPKTTQKITIEEFESENEDSFILIYDDNTDSSIVSPSLDGLDFVLEFISKDNSESISDDDSTNKAILNALPINPVFSASNATSTELYVNVDIIQKTVLLLGFALVAFIFLFAMHSLQTSEHLTTNLHVEDFQKKLQ